MSLTYFNPIKSDSGYCVSCDNVRIDFWLNRINLSEFNSLIFDNFRVDITQYPPVYSFARFERLAKITYGVDASMTVGFRFNGATQFDELSRDNSLRGFLDFNPNKTSDFDQFWSDLRSITSLCDLKLIKRIDVAIDLPFKRRDILLKKDNRRYECVAYSFDNFTEYLGCRNDIGRVKVYNKTLESKLNYDLTRVEITTDLDITNFLKSLPSLYYVGGDVQIAPEFDSLPDTDKFIINAEYDLLINHLDMGLVHWNSLSLHKRQKLEKFLLSEPVCLGLSVINFSSFASNIREVFL